MATRGSAGSTSETPSGPSARLRDLLRTSEAITDVLASAADTYSRRDTTQAPRDLVSELIGTLLVVMSDTATLEADRSRLHNRQAWLFKDAESMRPPSTPERSLWMLRTQLRLHPGGWRGTGTVDPIAEAMLGLDQVLLLHGQGAEVLISSLLSAGDTGGNITDLALLLAPRSVRAPDDETLSAYLERIRTRGVILDCYEGMLVVLQHLAERSRGVEPDIRVTSRVVASELAERNALDVRFATVLSILTGRALWTLEHVDLSLASALDAYVRGKYERCRVLALEVLGERPATFEALELLALCEDRSPDAERGWSVLPHALTGILEDVGSLVGRSPTILRSVARLAGPAHYFAPTPLGPPISRLIQSAREFDLPPAAASRLSEAACSTALTPRLVALFGVSQPILASQLKEKLSRWKVFDVSLLATEAYLGSIAGVPQRLLRRLPWQRRWRIRAQALASQGDNRNASRLFIRLSGQAEAPQGARHQAALKAIWVLLQTEEDWALLVRTFGRVLVHWPHLATERLAQRVLERVLLKRNEGKVESLPEWMLVVWRANGASELFEAAHGYTTYKAVVRFLQKHKLRDAGALRGIKHIPSNVYAEVFAHVLSLPVITRLIERSGSASEDPLNLRLSYITAALELRSELQVVVAAEQDALAEQRRLAAHMKRGVSPELFLDSDATVRALLTDEQFVNYARTLCELSPQMTSTRRVDAAHDLVDMITSVLAKRVWVAAREAFLYLPRTGLDWQLSFRIRHTRATSLLRASFHGVLAFESEGTQRTDPALRASIQALRIHPSERGALQQAFLGAAKEIDAMMRALVTERLQVAVSRSSASAFLDLSSGTHRATLVREMAQKASSAQALAHQLVEYLRRSARAALSELADHVREQLPREIGTALSKLRREIDQVLEGPAARNMIEEIDKVTRKFTQSAATLANWLLPKDETHSHFAALSFREAVLQALARVAGEDLVLTDRLSGAVKIPPTRWRVPSHVFPVIVDVLENLFHNALSHGTFSKVKVSLRRRGTKVRLVVANPVVPAAAPKVLAAIRAVTERLSQTRSLESAAAQGEAASREGASGLLKVQSALRHVLGDPNGTVAVAYARSRVAVTLDMEASLIGYTIAPRRRRRSKKR